MKIKLNNVEIEVEKELINKLKKYNYTVEETLGEILNRQLWKAANKLERSKCSKCGKPTTSTLSFHQAMAINKGYKTRKDFGVCECDEK